MVGHLLAVGLMLAMGYASGICALGGCGGAPWPSNGKLPGSVREKLEECGKNGPTALVPMNWSLAFVVHVTEGETEVRVDEVLLSSSTLHFKEVEDWMASALYGMRTPLEALALRRRKVGPAPAASPETRALLGQAQLLLLLEFLEVVTVGLTLYYVAVTIVEDSHHTKRLPAASRKAGDRGAARAGASAADCRRDRSTDGDCSADGHRDADHDGRAHCPAISGPNVRG